MAKDKIDELEKKKEELEAELNEIQGELDHSLDQVRNDVSNSLDPKSIIRKYPLTVAGGATLLGFLMGYRARTGGRRSSAGEISEALFAELKKRATHKAISFATDYLEELLEEKAEKHLSSNTDKNRE